MGFNLRRRKEAIKNHIGRGYMDKAALLEMNMENLRKLAKDLGVNNYSRYNKEELAETISKIPVDINKSK